MSKDANLVTYTPMMKSDHVVIFTSPDPDAREWTPIHPDDVPQTIKDPDVMGSLVAGDICNINEGDLWYRAEKYDS